MRLDVGHLSLLRHQGLMAARAAMSRPRQAAIGMVAALLLAGQMTGSLSGPRSERLAAKIAPSAVDYVRAVKEGFTFPAAERAMDATIAIARRETGMVEAGFARNVTLAQSVEQSVAVAAPQAEASLPQSIVQANGRIERPKLRSKTGESIVAASSAASLAYSSSGISGPAASAGFAEEGLENDIASTLVALAQEAHQRSGKPAMSAQAMSEYLSLYVLRDRVAAIGDALAQSPDAPATGMWVANLAGGMDDALFETGFGFGQNSFGTVAGYDAVVSDVFSAGDHLVYGGFMSAFGASPDGDLASRASFNETRGGSFGLFAALDDGAFSLSAMVRADFAQSLDFSAPNRLDVSDAMRTVKAEVVARYRFDVSDWTLEPSAGLSFASGRREIAGLAPASPRIEEAESLKIQLGVKASGVVYNNSGTSVEPSVTIMISEELRDQGGVTYLSGAPTGPSDPIQGKTVGALSFGVDVKDDSGWTGFVRADGQVSDNDKPKAGVSAGVKTQW